MTARIAVMGSVLLLSLPSAAQRPADASGRATGSGDSGRSVEAGTSTRKGTSPTPDAAAILAGQPEDVVRRLTDEQVIVMQEVRADGSLAGGIITALVIFDLPPERVYRYLSQTARQTEYRPELTRIETVRTTEAGPVDEHHMRILFQRYTYRLEFELDPERRRVAWKLDESVENDLDELGGLWELYEMEGRTLARFGTNVDVGDAVPGFLQDWITRKNLPTTMERVRRWVDSEGTYRP